jgi:hypothetical protein
MKGGKMDQLKGLVKDEKNPEWFDALTEECKSIINEASFQSRWTLIEGYHAVGQRIIDDSDKMSIESLVKEVGKVILRSERSLWYAVKFARQFPDLNKLPEGKNTTWRDICHNYLTEHTKSSEDGQQGLVQHVHRFERQVWNVCQEEGCDYKERIE